MTSELWATIITTVVVPVALRILVHYFPWLADVAAPGTGEAVKPSPALDAPPVYPLDEDES